LHGLWIILHKRLSIKSYGTYGDKNM